MEWIETTGSTVDEAKDRALDRLGIAEDDMQFEIIEEGSSSLSVSYTHLTLPTILRV